MGFYDFTCSCQDGSKTEEGRPANCSQADVCSTQPCGANQSCSVTAEGIFLCTCNPPFFGSVVGKPAACGFDECSAGSLRMCGPGQVCRDEDTTRLGTFNCSCLPPYNGSRIAKSADCWHDDCRDHPCGEGQTCIDGSPAPGIFYCQCKSGYMTTNRPARCTFNECREREETRGCFQCFDAFDRPDSVGDYKCVCSREGEERIGSPCFSSAAALEGEGSMDGGGSSMWILFAAALVLGVLAGAGLVVLFLIRHRARRIKFKDISKFGSPISLGETAGDTSTPVFPKYASMGRSVDDEMPTFSSLSVDRSRSAFPKFASTVKSVDEIPPTSSLSVDRPRTAVRTPRVSKGSRPRPSAISVSKDSPRPFRTRGWSGVSFDQPLRSPTSPNNSMSHGGGIRQPLRSPVSTGPPPGHPLRSPVSPGGMSQTRGFV
eukprot:Hpha_TRINITY_DN16551_c0_g1::TRINITY_DN16551_c0_g1_i1::g.136229::m.136229